MFILKGAEPYLFKGGKKAVLLIHSFTGSPAEMRLLADYLLEQGFTVMAVRLPGHGTQVEDLNKTDWKNWYNAVVDSYNILRGMCDEISVVGISMGSLLAIKLATYHVIDKLIVMSTPIEINNDKLPFLPIYRIFQSYMPKRKRQYNVSEIYDISYDKYPLDALSSMLELIEKVKENLPSVTNPTLIIQSRVEKTVKPKSANYINKNIGSKKKQLIWLENSGHMIVLDSQHDAVFEKIAEFLKEQHNE